MIKERPLKYYAVCCVSLSGALETKVYPGTPDGHRDAIVMWVSISRDGMHTRCFLSERNSAKGTSSVRMDWREGDERPRVPEGLRVPATT